MVDVQWVVTTIVAGVASAGAVASAAVAASTSRRLASPQVIAYVYAPEHAPATRVLRVENIGQAPAWDVSVSIDGATLSALGGCAGHIGRFGSEVWPFLPPGGSRETPVGSGPEFERAMGDAVGSVSVAFSGRRGGRVARSEFPIEATSFRGCGYVVHRSGG